jgi:hypothetical protein
VVLVQLLSIAPVLCRFVAAAVSVEILCSSTGGAPAGKSNLGGNGLGNGTSSVERSKGLSIVLITTVYLLGK